MGWTAKDLIGKKLVQVNGGAYEPISRQQVKKEKIQKLPNLLERAQMQAIPDNKIIGEDSKPSKNAKVKNATKIEINGVKFDSILESYMYGLLDNAGIDFDFQVKYILQEKFRYNGEAIRDISLTVDFIIQSKGLIIDTKGMQTQQGAIRWKLLKNWLVNNWRTFDPDTVLPTIEMPKNKKECDLLLNRILYDK